jgi:hypothetical protein
MPAVPVIPTVTKLAVAEKHMGTPAGRSPSEYGSNLPAIAQPHPSAQSVSKQRTVREPEVDAQIIALSDPLALMA